MTPWQGCHAIASLRSLGSWGDGVRPPGSCEPSQPAVSLTRAFFWGINPPLPRQSFFPSSTSPHIFELIQQSILSKISFYAEMTRVQTISSHYFEDGFLPSQPAVSRLPSRWDAWEDTLSDAASRVGLDLSPSPYGIPELEEWRDSVRKARTHSHHICHTSLILALTDGGSLFSVFRCLYYPRGNSTTTLQFSFGLGKF